MTKHNRDLDALRFLEKQKHLPFVANATAAHQAGAKWMIKHEINSRASDMDTAPLDIFITTGASKEIEFIRDAVISMGGKAVPDKALTKNQAGYRCEVPNSAGDDVIRFGLASASNDGKAPQTNLLKRICSDSDPRIIILVGMMGGIPGRVSLFDVVIPTVIYDGTTVGTEQGKPKWTKTSRSMHEKFGSVSATFAGQVGKELGIKVRNNKRVVTTGGTIEDVNEALFSEIVDYDKGEIVGMEMEGYAIFEASTDQQHDGKNVIFGFVKAVADFGVSEVSEQQVEAVRKNIPSLAEETDIKPRSNEQHKAAIQQHATALAFKTAVRLIEML